jgi:hypothetical protein
VERKRRERPTDRRGWWRGGWRGLWWRWHVRKRETGRRKGRDLRHRGRCVGKEKEGKLVHRRARGGRTRVVRTRLIEGHITRNAQPTTNRIPTSITLVLITVAKKNTLNRLSSQFGAFSRSKKNIAHAAKHAKSGVVRRATRETLHRNTTLQGSRRLNVDEVGGCGNGLSPKVGW